MSFLRRLYAWYEWLLLAGLAAAGALLVGMALMISADVLLRALVGISLPWAVEVAEYILYLSTFFAAPWVLRQGAHVRVDLVVRLLPPPLAAHVDRIAALIGLAVCCVLFYYGFGAAWDAFTLGSLIFKHFVVPEWWLLAVLPLAAALLSVEFLRRLAAPEREAPPEEPGALPQDGI